MIIDCGTAKFDKEITITTNNIYHYSSRAYITITTDLIGNEIKYLNSLTFTLVLGGKRINGNLLL